MRSGKSPTAAFSKSAEDCSVQFNASQFLSHHLDNIKSRFDKMLPISGEGSTSGKVALITGITGQVRVDSKVANIEVYTKAVSLFTFFAGKNFRFPP
jgi:hypothetical protein